VHDSGLLEHPQMLGDGLAGDLRATAEFHDGARLARRKRRHQ